MTSQSGTDRPIIIKRKKVVAGGGHHGGAWKVAYADFVTAMMAFFLLMWLLNATTEDQRIALATYFTPTISISNNSGGGDGALGGDTIFAEDTLTQMAPARRRFARPMLRLHAVTQAPRRRSTTPPRGRTWTLPPQ